MMIKKTLNHNKLYRPYAISSSSVNNFKCNKRLFSFMTERNYDYNYKKQKLNNRFQTTSSYIKPSVLDNNIQWKYDIGIIKKKIDDKLIQKPDGYRRDGIIFEKVLDLISFKNLECFLFMTTTIFFICFTLLNLIFDIISKSFFLYAMQLLLTGHSWHKGFIGLQIKAPISIIACA